MLTERLTECLRKNLQFPESGNLQQRGIADRIEHACNCIIKENFEQVQDASSRRSIEDIAIGNVYVDHKTSDIALDFKMPNMISIDRLRRLDRELIYNFVIYDSRSKSIVNTFALDVYELNWDYLKIQNLGKGQLQITNMAAFLQAPRSGLTVAEWKAKLRQEARAFYRKVQRDAERRMNEWPE
jgi:hypothetical protein